MSQLIENFYNSSVAELPAIIGEAGVVEPYTFNVSAQKLIRDEVSGIKLDHLKTNISKIYDSIEPVTVNAEGQDYTFEVGYIQNDPVAPTELRVGTYSSSYLKNPGNIFEDACRANAFLGRNIVYVGAPGNGLSSPLNKNERQYLRRYGRLLYEDEGKTLGLPIVKALGIALKEMGLEPEYISSDSAGSLLTTAHAATDAAHIRSVYQNVRTGMADRTPVQLAWGMLRTDSKISVAAANSSADPLKMQTKWSDFTLNLKPDRLKTNNYKAKTSLPMLEANLVGLGRGPSQGDPLLQDLSALLKRHSKADVLLTSGEHDPLVDADTLKERQMTIATQLTNLTRGRIVLATIEGAGHGPHTFYPQLMHAIQHSVQSV